MHNVSRIAAILLVVLATVLALIAFGMGRRTQVPETAKVAPAPSAPVISSNKVHAVVAGRLLPSGKAISASSLREIEVSSLLEGSYAQPELLVGEVPRVDIPEGTLITNTLLSNPIAMLLQPGERALAVPVDDVTGVGNRVQPGDYVDVVVTVKLTGFTQGTTTSERSETRLLASRLRVLAYGSRDLPDAATAKGARQNGTAVHADPTEAPAHMAVLAVPLNDIDPLVLGTQAGKLSLALRHPADSGMPSDRLFPSPLPVLMPRGDLTAEQRTWLSAPENLAYAGVDDLGLAGHSRTVITAPHPRASGPAELEIIRGANAPAPRTQLAVNP